MEAGNLWERIERRAEATPKDVIIRKGAVALSPG
jgi:hypothetical protein